MQRRKWIRKRNELKHSPFYRNQSVQNAELQEFSIMDKTDFMKNFDTINTVGIVLKEAYQTARESERTRDFTPEINGITIGLSSGTSGNRGVFLASENERAHWVAAVLDRVIGLSIKRRTIAFFLRANSNLYESVDSKILQFEFFDLLDNSDDHFQKLSAIQPDVLVAPPSMLLEIAQAIEDNRLIINPQKVISVAEVLHEEDKEYLESLFNQVIHQVYQCTEGFLASTCTNGTLHFHEDLLIIEKKFIDNEKKRFHPIITDLERKSQPIIRYELNDIIHEKDHCPCGSNHMAIQKIEGRSDDILMFINNNNKEVRIYPDYFRRSIIISNENIRDYAIIQKSLKILLLYINGNQEAYEIAKSGIIKLLEQHDISNVEIFQIATNNKGKGNKLRRIKNDNR